MKKNHYAICTNASATKYLTEGEPYRIVVWRTPWVGVVADDGESRSYESRRFRAVS